MKNVVLILAFLAMGCNSSSDAGAVKDTVLPEEETLAYRDCVVDSDCVYASNGCCGCANGAEDIAVNKTKLNDFEALFDCDGVMCTLMAPAEPCGSTGTISCKNHICEYTPAN